MTRTEVHGESEYGLLLDFARPKRGLRMIFASLNVDERILKGNRTVVAQARDDELLNRQWNL